MSSKFLLIIIIVLAATLRLYQLGVTPPSPDWDEAALGYNAYSILLTGKDEYARAYPIVLQSFADYKPALYMYFVVPFVALFGLDIIAVRLPSAIFGILTVLATYFLVLELFKRKDLALIASLLLAISPWHIQFSRIAFETNVGLAFNVFGVLFFLKGLKKPWLLLISALFFGLNVSVYQSERVFAPVLAMILVVIYWNEVFKLSKKYLISAFIVGIIAISPLLYLVITDSNTLSRFKGVSIFSEQTAVKLETQKRYLEDQNQNIFTGVLFHNKWTMYSREVVAGYISHFDLNWLFIRSDLERHHAPAMGQMYLWELPFLLFGIYALLFFKFPLKTKLLIFAWFFLAPLPASVTNGVPHAVRTLNFLPIFQLFVAIGVIYAYQWVHAQKSMKWRYPLYATVVFMALFNFVYFLNQYFVQQNYFYSQSWQYGYKEAVDYVKANEYKYKKIVVASQTPLDQSYVFFLYYLKYPPQEYQKESSSVDALSGNFADKHAFSKYEFRPFNWDEEKDDEGVLFIGRPQDFPKGVSQKEINYLDGTPAIFIVYR